MQLTKEVPWEETHRYFDWHKLLWAQSGFSQLDLFAGAHGVPKPDVARFADDCNRRNRLVTLAPAAPITAIPISRLPDPAETDIQDYLALFLAELEQFLLLNEANLNATDVAVDLRLGGNQPPRPEYIDAVEQVLGQRGEAAGIRRVTIFL
jgi:hypothetical protein